MSALLNIIFVTIITYDNKTIYKKIKSTKELIRFQID